MSTLKHTPGKWTLNYPHPSTDNFIIGNDVFEDFVMNPIAEVLVPACESEAQQLEEQEANAKLIAAAPDLLEALCYAIRFIELCPKLEEEDRPRGLEKWQSIVNKATE